MRFHVVQVPQSCTTKAFSMCGFSQKAINFCWAMKTAGHEVFLYGGETNEAECTEFIVCIDEEARKEIVGFSHFVYPSWNPQHPARVAYNERVAEEINKRKQPGDFVCIIGGNTHKLLIGLVPDLKVVEYGIGYSGYFSKYKVWESHSWRGFLLGKHHGDVPRPSACDTVIPCFYDHNEYAIGPTKDYVLFLGRVTQHKGIQNACNAAKMAGKRLLVAGLGEAKDVIAGAEYLGPVDHATKIELLSGAERLICPTVTMEPFGNVAVEAQLSGVPVISTNWGGFTETVAQGGTGWRCETVEEMAEALCAPVALSKEEIRRRAVVNWSREVVAPKYEYYFKRIAAM